MNYSQRVELFSKLGDKLLQLNSESPLLQQAYIYNNWFTLDMQIRALHAWGCLLNEKNIGKWLDHYQLIEPNEPKTVAIIMAGNIPLVGFHDLLCVLITGNRALIKPSSDDTKLIGWVIEQILELSPEMKSYIRMAEDYQLKNFDAVIATGSNNSNRYFEYYFKDKSSLLRKNRKSLAILTGNESSEDLDNLADDVFLYFGLGCRNVSKLLVPKGYNLEPMFLAFERYKDIINHNKYANNYTYHKALFLMNQDPHLDNGFLIVRQDDALASPLSVLMFQIYENQNDIDAFLKLHEENIQCTVGLPQFGGNVPFGKSQQPELWDYADGIDTIEFLKGLN
ncbi:MAG: acyl-CoA reductase [Bacteroidetes bacterium B1(2017)]|nr:MAG: acyl-CoA reductase [Bacteroidetes bacterium B1(2017)]